MEDDPALLRTITNIVNARVSASIQSGGLVEAIEYGRVAREFCGFRLQLTYKNCLAAKWKDVLFVGSNFVVNVSSAGAAEVKGLGMASISNLPNLLPVHCVLVTVATSDWGCFSLLKAENRVVLNASR